MSTIELLKIYSDSHLGAPNLDTIDKFRESMEAPYNSTLVGRCLLALLVIRLKRLSLGVCFSLLMSDWIYRRVRHIISPQRRSLKAQSKRASFWSTHMFTTICMAQVTGQLKLWRLLEDAASLILMSRVQDWFVIPSSSSLYSRVLVTCPFRSSLQPWTKL